MSSLSSSARSKALSFVVAGKSAKQLEEWLKLHDADAAARLKGTTDRYPFMVAVEDRLAELRKQQNGKAAEEEEEEEEAPPAKTAGKRKSRASIGYEAGKPAPASPRVKKVTGKRKSTGAAAARDSDDESAATGASDDSAAAAAASARPTKKIRTAKSMAPQSTARRATHAPVSSKKPKGRSARAEAEEEDDMSEGEEEDDDMVDVKAAASKSAKSRASMPSQSTSAAVAAAAARKASPPAPYVDPSLFGPSSPQTEDQDVRMRSPTPSPEEDKFEIVVAPSPTVANPFQVASPGASASTSPAPAAAAAARPSFAGRASSAGTAVPISTARKSASPSVPVAVGLGAPSGYAKFNPSLAAPSVPFSVSPGGGGLAGFAGVARVSPMAAEPPPPSERYTAADDYALPSHRAPVLSPSVRRASMPSSAYLQQQQAAEDEFAEQAQMRRRRHSDVYQQQQQQQQRQFESKYAAPDETEEYELANEEEPELTEDEKAAMRAERRARFSERRYSGAGKITLGGGETEEDGTTSGGSGAAPIHATRPSLFARVRSFMGSLGQFLLRTLLIGLMLMTVVLLFSEPAFKHLIFGRPISTTVFCPSDPNELPPTEFPPGQLVCAPCPPHGFCTEGKLTCVDSELYVREGDECVLNDQSHRRSAALKEIAVGVLERRKGDVSCGLAPRGSTAVMSAADLKKAVEDEVTGDLTFPMLWSAALTLLSKEAAPVADKDITTARVLLVSQGRDANEDVYVAVNEQLNMGCTLRMLLTQWLWYIIGASLVISIITYLWFLLRRWRWRRSQVGPVAELVREYLIQVARNQEAKAVAVTHARDEYLTGRLTGRKGDPVVWEAVVNALNKDTRIEKSKHTYAMNRSPHELEAPTPSPLYAQRRGSASDYLRVPAMGSSTPYNEKGHSPSPVNRHGWMNSSRTRMSIVVLAVMALCMWIWTHPSQFAANSNAGAEQQFSAAAGGGADGPTRAQTMRSLSLAAIDAGRPVPLGVEFQCPAPSPCPIPLCPKADATGRMEPITADCPPAPQCTVTECPDCPAQVECPAPVECPASTAASSSSSLESLPAYMSSRLETVSANSRNLVPGKDDLALQGSEADLSSHEVTWHYCQEGLALKEHAGRDAKGLALCPENARNEWFWQLSWFERTDARNKTGAKIGRHSEIQTPICAQLPPKGYTFPAKYPALPMDPSPGQPMSKTPAGKVDANALSHGAFPWKNLRMEKITDMLDFNSATPKNLYHFDGPNYDRQQHHFLKEVASVIPFEQKVRMMLDVGAGGASLGLLVKRLYDVQTVSTVFADWPYCEYISERGGLCMLLDSMTAMPFAKFTYDAVHSSWIYHGVYPKDLFKIFHEQNRVLRPGGYMWWVGGWSREQMAAIQSYAKALGYKELYSNVKKVANANKPGAWRFGTLQDIPYEVDWTVVWVKPIKAEPMQCSRA